jgi:hypothetical protein
MNKPATEPKTLTPQEALDLLYQANRKLQRWDRKVRLAFFKGKKEGR